MFRLSQAWSAVSHTFPPRSGPERYRSLQTNHRRDRSRLLSTYITPYWLYNRRMEEKTLKGAAAELAAPTLKAVSGIRASFLEDGKVRVLRFVFSVMSKAAHASALRFLTASYWESDRKIRRFRKQWLPKYEKSFKGSGGSPLIKSYNLL